MIKQTLIIGILLFVFANMAIAQKMTVKDSDSHVLMEVNDEGTMGSITLPDTNAVLSSETNKLYNLNGSLIWNGTALGTSGSAGGWTDDGTVVRLTNSTDKVGIGDDTPTHTLDVSGKIGIRDTQVIFLPDQTDFAGTLIVGSGGGSLNHTSSSEGWFNTVVGIGALGANTTGRANTAIGNNSLHDNETGDYNIAIGFQTLYHNTIGDNNTASGSEALYSNDTGYGNTAIGFNALYINTTGGLNTAIGSEANRYNEEGSYNTIIGYQAGRGTSVHNKSGNIFIGCGAGYNETGDNKLYIENSSSATPLIGGDFDADEVYLNGNVGIGDTSPTHTLDVSGKIGINDTQILYLPDQMDFEGTLIIGTGGGSLDYTSSWDGRYNTAVGIGALNANTTGHYNTASGYQALYSNTTGFQNTASGDRALDSNTTGHNNTANGGYALCGNTTGHSNTACGYFALETNYSGNSNTALGYGADVSTDDLTNATVIGYDATVNASNKVVIGNSSVTTIGGYADWSKYSDRRFKENIVYNDDPGLDFIMKLNTVSFNYKEDENKRRRDGLIAQDVEAALKELDIEFSGLIVDDDEQKTMNLSYGNFVLPLINAVKEQQEMIFALEVENTKLKAIVTGLCKKMGYEEIHMSSAESQ